MADEKDQSTGEQAEEQKKSKKSALPLVLMVLLGAVLGGAGVVFLTPKPPAAPHGPPPSDIRLYDHPDPMEFTINPVVERGHKQAMIHFLFTYKADSKDVVSAAPGGDAGGHGGGADTGHLPPVLESIKVNWNRAYSRCLEVLSNQRAETLLDPDGKRMVKRMLIDELSVTLFPDGVATVNATVAGSDGARPSVAT